MFPEDGTGINLALGRVRGHFYCRLRTRLGIWVRPGAQGHADIVPCHRPGHQQLGELGRGCGCRGSGRNRAELSPAPVLPVGKSRLKEVARRCQATVQWGLRAGEGPASVGPKQDPCFRGSRSRRWIWGETRAGTVRTSAVPPQTEQDQPCHTTQGWRHRAVPAPRGQLVSSWERRQSPCLQGGSSLGTGHMPVTKGHHPLQLDSFQRVGPAPQPLRHHGRAGGAG